jgi:hypothetical protein
MRTFLRYIVLTILAIIFIAQDALCMADDTLAVVFSRHSRSDFLISSAGKQAGMLVSNDDYPGVIRAFTDLGSDIKKVTGDLPILTFNIPGHCKELIIAGTIGKSPLIESLVKRKKLNVDDISGKWESFIIETVDSPFPGIKKALVIAGSDKRGTIYGIYELSGKIGVSPWYWWADVTPIHRNALCVLPCRYVQGEPSVRYRGIFLNDEAPALTNWVAWKFGMVKPSVNPPVPAGVANYGHEFYSRIFELILRLKGNYLWPAMWNNAFNEDDTLNPVLADEYGIVMGTSHQEPMLRAQKEWDRRYRNTLGYWNYSKHSEILNDFWREGIRRNKNFESIITMGLRGANDTEMAPGGPEANIKMLEGIINTQRGILAEEMNPDVTKIPQLWCLYKEVQDYYNAGLRVPDDITMLWAEDNWGNIRRLPTKDERNRSGGAGIYYHFDYHGGPRSYQWLNTNTVSKIWDQMSLAKEYGADRIWIVNVGHFRGYELPLEYFMSLAWDTEKHNGENITSFTKKWAAEQFGPEYAGEIADILSSYTRFNSRRKPELLSPSTYSLVNYHEAENVVNDYNKLVERAVAIDNKLSTELHDAFYQLVLFPVRASALVNELYYFAGRNALYAKQGRSATNDMADTTEILFRQDTTLMGYYNRTFAGGKWNHFMDQTHLGYLNWADPPFNSLRAISLKRIVVSYKAEMGIMAEGTEECGTGKKIVLPYFDFIDGGPDRSIDIFNKGKETFNYTAESDKPWIKISNPTGVVDKGTRLWVNINWSSVPEGKNEGNIIIRGAGREVYVGVIAMNRMPSGKAELNDFFESGGYVSINAEHFSKKIDAGSSHWDIIEGYGKTQSAMRATSLPDAPPATPETDSPCLEYNMYLFTADTVSVQLTLSPSLNFIPGRNIRVAVSFDTEKPQYITVVPGNYKAQNGNADWEKCVADNARYVTSKHIINTIGQHTLKIWMIDPGVVMEKIVVNTGGVRPSYLGPPESYNNIR